MADQRSAFSDPTQVAGYLRNLNLYSPDNPQRALQNVLLDKGYNVFSSGNPFVAGLMQLAGPLSMAFSVLQAASGGVPNLDALNAAGGSAGQFKDFLSGRLGGGGLFGALGQARAAVPSVLDAVRDYQANLMAAAQGGGDTSGLVGSVNPFLIQMEQILNSPEGATRLLGGLTAPFLSRSVGRSYLSGLQDVTGVADRRRFMDESFGQPGAPEFYDYLFPRR